MCSGELPLDAFLSGYRLGLLVAAALVAVGGLAAWLALRGTTAAEELPPGEVSDEELALAR